MKLTAFFCLLTAVSSLGCASSPGSEAVTPGDDAGEAQTTPESAGGDEPEPASAPQSKSEQCEVLGDVIQSGIAGGTDIVGLEDRARLESLASDWKSAAERVAAVDSDVPELEAVRDRLVTLAKGMAEALAATGGTGTEAERKEALARYYELNGQLDGIVDEFNAACG